VKRAVRELAGVARAAWRRSRALRIAVLAVILELVLRWGFSAVGRSRGLVSPGGTLHADVAVLGVAYILTRVVVRFAIPALVAGAIAAALLQRIIEGRRERLKTTR
jgi:hypothetical protein